MYNVFTNNQYYVNPLYRQTGFNAIPFDDFTEQPREFDLGPNNPDNQREIIHEIDADSFRVSQTGMLTFYKGEDQAAGFAAHQWLRVVKVSDDEEV